MSVEFLVDNLVLENEMAIAGKPNKGGLSYLYEHYSLFMADFYLCIIGSPPQTGRISNTL